MVLLLADEAFFDDKFKTHVFISHVAHRNEVFDYARLKKNVSHRLYFFGKVDYGYITDCGDDYIRQQIGCGAH